MFDSIQCELQSLKWRKYEANLTDGRCDKHTTGTDKDAIASVSSVFNSLYVKAHKKKSAPNVRVTALREEEKEAENDVKRTRDRMLALVERLIHSDIPCFGIIDNEKLTLWVFNVNEKHSFPTLETPLTLIG